MHQDMTYVQKFVVLSDGWSSCTNIIQLHNCLSCLDGLIRQYLINQLSNCAAVFMSGCITGQMPLMPSYLTKQYNSPVHWGNWLQTRLPLAQQVFSCI